MQTFHSNQLDICRKSHVIQFSFATHIHTLLYTYTFNSIFSLTLHIMVFNFTHIFVMCACVIWANQPTNQNKNEIRVKANGVNAMNRRMNTATTAPLRCSYIPVEKCTLNENENVKVSPQSRMSIDWVSEIQFRCLFMICLVVRSHIKYHSAMSVSAYACLFVSCVLCVDPLRCVLWIRFLC